jgi:UDP-N-acetyl-D-mannosaminuronate dehydrogenase
LIVLATGHDAYKTFDFSAYTIPVVDTRNAVNPATRPAKYYKA